MVYNDPWRSSLLHAQTDLTLDPLLDVGHVGEIADDGETGDAEVEGLQAEERHDVARSPARRPVDEHDGDGQGRASHCHAHRLVFRWRESNLGCPFVDELA